MSWYVLVMKAMVVSVSILAYTANARAAEPALTPAELRDDLAIFRRDFFDRDRAFSPAARAEGETRLKALERTRRPMKPGPLGLELCRIAALADDGHTFCGTEALMAHFNQIPLELAMLADGLLVVGADPDHEDLLGARLVRIGGRPIDAVTKTLRALFGGEPLHRDRAAFPFLKSPAVLRALGIGNNPARTRYSFVAEEGRAVERDIGGGPAGPRDDWRWSPPGDRMPWAYREMNKTLRWRDAPELDAVIAQLRLNSDSGGRTIAGFLAEVEQDRQNLHRRNFVLDLRFDPGGDLTKTRDFLLGLPERVGPDGIVFAFIGAGTFSAGIANAAYLKQAGGKRVVLVGQPPGDRLVFFAEGTLVTLPRSKLTVMPATARHDYRDGCRAYEDCYVGVAQPGQPHGSPPQVAALVRPIPISIPTLDPDIPAPFTIEAFRAGRDPAIEAVAAALKHAP